MIYIKTQLEDGTKLKVDVYEDEFFTMCPTCSKEEQVEFDDLLGILKEGLDFSATKYFCVDCSKKISKDAKMKEVNHLKIIK